MISALKTIFKHRLKPMDHQDKYFQLSRTMKYYGFFWEMGTGKSKPIIDTAAWLFLTGEIDGLIIISDKGCYMGWHDEEVHKHIPDGVPYRIAYWSSYMQKMDKMRLETIMTAKDDMLDVLCVNVEAFSSGAATAIVERFIKSHYCLMCVDEATSIKNHTSLRTKAIKRLGLLCDYRRVCTGTPITQSPLDLFAICDFLQPGVLGFKSFVGFRSHYAVMRVMTLGPRSFQKVVGYQRLDELTASIQPFSSRLLKSECLDLPDKIYETVYVERTPEQEKMYDGLKDTALLQLEQGLLTSTSAITTINKLHQINCGHVKLDDGTIVDIPSRRASDLMELLEKLGDEKVIIWCRFQRDVELVMDALYEKFGGDGLYPVHYYGKTPDSDRPVHLGKFKADPKCRWFVGTAATGGKGINGLQCVSKYVAYYSSDFNLEDRLQSEDRSHRHGQRWPVTYFDLVVRNSVDTRILDALKKKEDLSYEVLDKLREILA